jgi:tetratricopeptide (TPR) repeat protein/ADP-heptose:LPS heptosyltransferase
MNRRDRRAASKSSGKNPGAARKASTPGTPAVLCEAGLHHFRAQRHLDAQLCCQQALELDPDHADTLHLMGLLSLHARQYDHAVEWISRAIRQYPRPDYLASLGTTLREQGRHDEALKVFDKAIQLSPDNAELWKQMGDILVQQERHDQALLGYQHALKLDPRHWQAAEKSAFILYQSGRFEEAIRYCDLCNEPQPSHARALQIRALSLRALKRNKESLADNRLSHALNPGSAETCNNLGDSLQSLGRYEEALEWFDRALALRPDFILAFTNKMVALLQTQRFDEAIAIYHRIKAIDPNNAMAEWYLSLIQLLKGNFEAGWAGREARRRVESLSTYPKFPQPIWLGEEPIEGKTILICTDEGLGDTIQFARYVPMVAERGAQVVLLVQDAVYPLLSALPGVSQCIRLSAGGMLPSFDMHCPICSLPLAFGTRLDTIPSASYLPAPPAERVQTWEDRLGPREKLRVGLVWSGNPDHTNDLNRSIPLRQFADILDTDVIFVSLQKDPKPDDKATLLKRSDIVDLTAHLTDFVETAALMACLDLVITVDTSVVHLSGALGRPTWLLLPYTPDFRWLLDRDDSPWYPSMRLFRQTETREYESVLDRVRTELMKLISVRKPADQPV